MGKYLVNLAKSLMGELKIAPHHDLSQDTLREICKKVRRMHAETLGKIAATRPQMLIEFDGTRGAVFLRNPLLGCLVFLDEADKTPRDILVLLAGIQILGAMIQLRKNSSPTA